MFNAFDDEGGVGRGEHGQQAVVPDSQLDVIGPNQPLEVVRRVPGCPLQPFYHALCYRPAQLLQVPESRSVQPMDQTVKGPTAA